VPRPERDPDSGQAAVTSARAVRHPERAEIGPPIGTLARWSDRQTAPGRGVTVVGDSKVEECFA